MSQATLSQTANRYESIIASQGAPNSPHDTLRGENGSDDEPDSDSLRRHSQRQKLKHRATTSGSREHSIAREALAHNRRLSGSTSRSSNREDMLWENGGTSEEISAAALRKEKKREQKEREKELRREEERDRERAREQEIERERERDRRDDKRERKHHRSKSEKDRSKTGMSRRIKNKVDDFRLILP
jgi:hypothetical protein